MRNPFTILKDAARNGKRWFHLLLLLCTFGTAFSVGMSEGVIGGLLYAAGLLSILLAHEMGHYLAARRHGVPATLPFFIPMPLPPFGTMGAVIRMKGVIPDRRALLDIGAAGPYAGLLVSLPLIIIGAGHSLPVETASMGSDAIALGEPLLFRFIVSVTAGNAGPEHDLLLHPLAYAGWVGLFVTALNLLPVGQLDGGHIMYALFGGKSRYAAVIYHAVLFYIALFHFAGWLLPVILLFIIRRHPPTGDDRIALDPLRRAAGIGAMIIFFFVFVPVPFGPAEGLVTLLLGLFR
ncbi:site-2 protease family protein [bacterium]|nr:site-2 protease family protein [bacterium]